MSILRIAGALPKAGGTLTGVLTLAADPTSSMQAATKNYVDARAAVSLPISGGTLTGPLSLPSNPASALQAAPKQYVDSQVAGALPLAGGTLTGALTLPGDPTTALQAATKRYVDSAGGAATGVINVRSAPYNAQLNGVADDTAAFKAAYQAAVPGSAIYVPNGVTVLQNPSNWGIPADQAGEVDRRRHVTAGWHAAVECNSGRRQSGQQLPAGTRRRQQRHQLRSLAERFAANRFRGFPFVLHRQSRRRANGRRR